MDPIEDKEVYFHEYCKTCKYLELNENEEPCDTCLDNSTNVESHKPVEWKPKDGSEKNS